MSIFTKQALIESFPAYNVFRREATRDGWVEITAADTLGLKKLHPRGDYFKTFSPGSVVSYALQYNECPIEAVANAKARGHALRWINANATALTAHKREAETLIEVTIGMKVRFEGLVATIEQDHNDNLKFVPVVAEQAAA